MKHEDLRMRQDGKCQSFPCLNVGYRCLLTDQDLAHAVSSSTFPCRCTHPTADMSEIEARQEGTEEQAAELGQEVHGANASV